MLIGNSLPRVFLRPGQFFWRIVSSDAPALFNPSQRRRRIRANGDKGVSPRTAPTPLARVKRWSQRRRRVRANGDNGVSPRTTPTPLARVKRWSQRRRCLGANGDNGVSPRTTPTPPYCLTRANGVGASEPTATRASPHEPRLRRWLGLNDICTPLESRIASRVSCADARRGAVAVGSKTRELP
jgi:hypothetical protein